MKVEEMIEKAFKLFDEGHLHEAETLYTEVLSMIKDTESAAYNNTLHGFGYVKAALDDFPAARGIYQKLLQKAVIKEDKQNQAVYLHQLGMVERMAEKYMEAKTYFEQEWDIYNTYFPNLNLGFAVNLYEQGYILLKQGSVGSAKDMMEQSLEYALQSKDQIAVGCSYRGIGEIYCLESNNIQSDIHFEKAMKAFERGGDQTGIQEVVTLMEDRRDIN